MAKNITEELLSRLSLVKPLIKRNHNQPTNKEKLEKYYTKDNISAFSGKRMTAQILMAIMSLVKSSLNSSTIKDWKRSGYKRPTLAVVLRRRSRITYVKGKERDCQEVGIESKSYRLPKTIEQQAIEDLLDELNVDPSIDGILLQSPIPDHLDENKL